MDPEQNISPENDTVANEIVPESFNFDQDTGQENTQPVSEGQPVAPESDNEAWKPILDALPDGFHQQVRPVLKEWDRKVNERFQQKAQEYQTLQQRYQAFDPLVEQGLTPQQISAAQVIIRELNTNPRGLYERLGQHFGLNAQQAQQAVEQAQDIYDANEDQQIDDPRIEQLAQQQAQIQQFLEKQAQEQRQAEIDAQVQAEAEELRTKYNLSDFQLDRVFEQAVLMMQSNPEITLEDAFRRYDNIQRAMFAQNSNNSAPSVMPTNGATPITPQKKFTELDKRAQNDDLVAAIRNLQ